MKNKEMADYWKDDADKFSNYYKKEGSFVSRFLNKRTEILLPLIGDVKGKTVLDLGCGNGVHIKLIAPRCETITGMDISEKMLDETRKELRKLGVNNYNLKICDVQKPLEVKKESFDLIISMGLLDYVESPKHVLKECHRILRDNGYIIFTIPKKPSLFFPLRTKSGNLIKEKVFDLTPIYNILTKKDVMELSKSCGFEIENIESIWTTMWIIKARKSIV